MAFFNKSSNQNWKISFSNIPRSLGELKSLSESGLSEPYQAAGLLIPALCLWPDNKEEAKNMVNFLRGSASLSPYEVQFISDRLGGNEYIPFSYFEGTSPANGYQPNPPYNLTISSVPNSFDEENYATLYLQSSGADSP